MMNKTIQFSSIFMIFFMMLNFTSSAQCDRHGDGNKPKFYLSAVKAADSSDEYSSKDSTHIKTHMKVIDICELEALLIAVTHMKKKSQIAYLKNLETYLGNGLNSSVLDTKMYNFIFANNNQQMSAYTKLYKTLKKSQLAMQIHLFTKK